MTQTVTRLEHPSPPSRALTAGNDSAVLLQLIERGAADPSVDIEKLERMYAMYERASDKQATAAFSAAMVRAQQRLKPVVRDAVNTHTNSRYARLEQIDREASPIYTEEGFSLSFGTVECRLPGYVCMVCDVMHEAGHTRRYQAELPLDGNGARGNANKTGVQAHGSTFSYGRRYLTVMIFNISITDEDDDGNGDRDDPPQRQGRQTYQQAQREPEPEPQQEQAPAVTYYDDAKFQKNLPAYQELIVSGKKTAEHIIVNLNTKAPLSEQQMQTLRTFTPTNSQQQQVTE